MDRVSSGGGITDGRTTTPSDQIDDRHFWMAVEEERDVYFLSQQGSVAEVLAGALSPQR